MTREEVYDKCVEKDFSTGSKSDGIWTVKQLLPKEAIDAIIDCAVEEAIKAFRDDDKKCMIDILKLESRPDYICADLWEIMQKIKKYNLDMI